MQVMIRMQGLGVGEGSWEGGGREGETGRGQWEGGGGQ